MKSNKVTFKVEINSHLYEELRIEAQRQNSPIDVVANRALFKYLIPPDPADYLEYR